MAWLSRSPALTRQMLDCGVIGDGRTDDGDALLRFLDLTGSRKYLPRTVAPGMPADYPSYYSTKTLRLKNAGMILEGDGAGYIGGTILQFAPDVTGISIEAPACTVRDMTPCGSQAWSGAWYDEAILPKGYGGVCDADGIRVGNTYATLDNLCILGFGRHGVNASNQDTGGPSDDCVFNRLFCGSNRGHGFNIDGGDSNSCVWTGCVYYVNQMWGKRAASFLSGTHVGDQATENGRDDSEANAVPPNQVVALMSRRNGVVTLRFRDVYAPRGNHFQAGHGITVVDAPDPSFLGTFIVTNIIDNLSLQYLQAGPDTSEAITGGTARMATPTEAWKAAGVRGGAYCAPINGSRQVWINPYAEGGQAIAMTTANLVLGAVFGAQYDLTMGLPGELTGSVVGVGTLGANWPISTVWPVDSIAQQVIRLGSTVPQPLYTLYQHPVTQKTIWEQIISETEWSLWYHDPSQDPSARCFFKIDAKSGQVLINGKVVP